jgi:predicted DCC family thiol-disulfide oxidoreductase YuxK
MPAPLHAAAWAAQIAAGVAALGAAAAVAAPLALWRGTRPALWLALLGLHAARALHGGADPGPGTWLLQAFSFDPAWVRPRAPRESARLFYDGGCGLCHRAVRFVLAEDPEGRAFRFAPLVSESFERLVSAQQRVALPDSLVLSLPDGRVLVRSGAVREIGARLGGLWRVLAFAAGALPARWLDALYDVVARHRARWFAKPADACPLLPPALRDRFE